MRRTLEGLSLCALVDMGWTTWRAFHGRVALPDRIPTHFDVSGQPNGWGSPASLLLLPCIAVFVYVLLTVVSLFPSSFNYPVRVTAQNRDRLQGIALSMMAWVKAELCCLFALIQLLTIAAARIGRLGMSPFMVPLAIVIVFVTIGAHFIAMGRAYTRAGESVGG